MSDLFATAMMEAIQGFAAMKGEGVSVEDRQAFLEHAVRQCWPRGRAEPWHYLCEQCSDTGLRMEECPGDATCGRDGAWAARFQTMTEHLPHEFGKPCWCVAGKRFVEKPTGGDDVTSAGRTRRKGSFVRFSR